MLSLEKEPGDRAQAGRASAKSERNVKVCGDNAMGECIKDNIENKWAGWPESIKGVQKKCDKNDMLDDVKRAQGVQGVGNTVLYSVSKKC